MLLRILFLLLLGLVIPAFYIDRRFLKNRRKMRLWLWIPNLALGIIFVVLTLTEDFSTMDVKLKGLFLFIYLFIVIPETVFAFVSVIARLFHRYPSIERGLNLMAGFATFITAGAIAFGYFWGGRMLVVKETTIYSKDLPQAFDGFRIVQFSDFHVGTYNPRQNDVRRIINKINEQRGDIIVFTGDLVNYRSVEAKPYLPILRTLHAHYGVFSVMGNHDYMTYVRWANLQEQWKDIRTLQHDERQCGWQLLLNESRFIKRGQDSIAIVGVENDGKPPFPQRGDLKKALKNVPRKEGNRPFFKVLLSHDPTHWRRKVLPTTDIQLMLAGHTHGMQIEVFGLSPARLFYKEWGGLYQEGSRALFVSLGLGEVLLPIRFGAWPEINVITLKSTRQ